MSTQRSVLALLIAGAIAALGAQPDPWTKVVKLETGSELHIFKKGSSKPVTGTFAEANDESLIVFLKKEEIAIPRDQIDRIDARPPARGSVHMSKETHTTVDPNPAPSAPIDGPAQAGSGPSASTSTVFSSPSRPGFATVYRRPPPHPAQ